MKISILIDDLFDEREFIYPYYRFLESDFSVDVIGIEKKSYVLKPGFSFH